MKILAVIPARYNSKRFPGKPLINIQGKSMIQRVIEQSEQCKEISKVIVATDDQRIASHIKDINKESIITSKDHNNGTSRCCEAIIKMKESYNIILNIQGDEPFIDPNQISELISLFKNEKVQIGTLARQIHSYEDYTDKNCTKVSFNSSNIAESFTRIGNLNKLEFNTKKIFKHIGIYGFRSKILNQIASIESSSYIDQENLEQIKWMDHYQIKVGITLKDSFSINKEEDIKRILDFPLKKS